VTSHLNKYRYELCNWGII